MFALFILFDIFLFLWDTYCKLNNWYLEAGMEFIQKDLIKLLGTSKEDVVVNAINDQLAKTKIYQIK